MTPAITKALGAPAPLPIAYCRGTSPSMAAMGAAAATTRKTILGAVKEAPEVLDAVMVSPYARVGSREAMRRSRSSML